MFPVIRLTTLTATLLTLFLACNGGKMPEQTTQFPRIKDVSSEKLENFSQKKIYFGHQSVGFNIIDGIKDVMKDHTQIKLNIVETANESDFKVGLFAHSRVGKNVNPKSKTDEFVEFINKGIGGKADAAALKFCYVDIRADTNTKNVFIDYSDSISQLIKKYPDNIRNQRFRCGRSSCYANR